ncbi:MAG: hypothetical protein HYU36_09145 [Planctomycetes bacterium]|nr:hypothetical protein [Planctomycetota bacterium]
MKKLVTLPRFCKRSFASQFLGLQEKILNLTLNSTLNFFHPKRPFSLDAIKAPVSPKVFQ